MWRAGDGQVKARRCTICSINYPPFVEVCRICNDETWPMYKSGPDEDWEQRVGASLGEGLFLEPPKIAYAVQHPAGAELPLHVGDGRMWLSHDGLLSVGYKSLEPDTIVFVNDRFYELQGFSASRNSWWVELVETDGVFDDLTPAMFEKWQKEADDG